MLKRSLVFENAYRLSLSNAQLVVTMKDDAEYRKTIPIEDIGMVIINHPMVNVTIPLLNALSEGGVMVVFCNEKGMPASMLCGMASNQRQGEILRHQLAAGEALKKNLWKQIIASKIKNQAALLDKLGKQGDALRPLCARVKSGDADNRDGVAAKFYWTELFGKGFVRHRELPGANTLLNYGYSVLRAAVARALLSSGLLPALGIFHKNRSNAHPLADDLMEPFRPFVDEIVFDLCRRGETELTLEVKSQLIRLLYCDTHFGKTAHPLGIGLTMTTASLARCYAKEALQLNLPLLK